MTINIKPNRVEAIMKSPEFLKEFNKICEGLDVEGIDVPDSYDDDTALAICEYSFSDLQRMCQLLPNQYKQIYDGDKSNVLILKLAATIILSCKPKVFIESDYSELVTSYSTLIDQCNEKFEQARQKAVETIYTREMLAGKI